jgi:hypothetical protein
MWLQFFSQNAHFALLLFAALVSFAICWLYVDAWSNRHEGKELIKFIGCALLGLSFLLQATLIEQAVLGRSLIGDLGESMFGWLRLAAYIGLIIGQIVDPLQAVPKLKGLVLDENPKAGETVAPGDKDVTSKAPAFFAMVTLACKWALPLGALTIAGLYWRRATVGLERHLKPVARGFLLLGLADLFYLSHLLRETNNPLLYNLVAPYGPVWWFWHALLLGGCLILGRWVWFYLTKRFFSQLFMIFMSLTVVVFLVVSVSFTSLLLRNIRQTSLNNLDTAANVLDYALQTKQAETTASAEQLAGTSSVVDALASRNRTALATTINAYLLQKRQTNIIVTNASGQVQARGRDAESWGDSLSEDPLIRRALIGTNQASVVVHEAVNGYAIEVQSAQAIRGADNTIIGVIVASLELGPSFVDGLKAETGLDSSMYGGNVLAATTFVGPDGKTRNVGVKLNNKKVQNQVLTDGKSYTSPVSIQNRQMLGAFLPLKDVDHATVGMILVAEPESNVLKAAGRSVELTFLLTAVLLVLSIVPIYFIANGLVKQLD